MTNKEHFVKFVESVNQFCVDSGYFNGEYDYDLDKAKAFFDSLKKETAANDGLTDKGKVLLTFIQENYPDDEFKSSDIAAGLGVTSRTVTGSMLKLVNDGYVNKVTEKGVSPIVYVLSEQGKDYKC